MDDPCISPEDMALVPLEGPDGARRRHLAGCPRCRALFASYRSFLEPEPVPEIDLDGVNAELTAFVRSRIGGESPVGAASRPRGSRFRLLFGPLFRPLPLAGLAGASAVILLLLLSPDPFDRVRPDRHVTRGGREEARFASLPAERTDGGFLLRWPSEPGADRYEIVILDPGLDEVGRVDASGDTSLVLTAEGLRDLPGVRGRSAQELLWQTIALRDGDEIAHTSLQAFPGP